MVLMPLPPLRATLLTLKLWLGGSIIILYPLCFYTAQSFCRWQNHPSGVGLLSGTIRRYLAGFLCQGAVVLYN